MKISISAKTILYPPPVMIVGTYDAEKAYFSVCNKIGDAFSIGKRLK